MTSSSLDFYGFQALSPTSSGVFTRSLPVDTYAEGVGFMMSWANVTVFDTDVGLVLVDSGAKTHGESIYVSSRFKKKRRKEMGEGRKRVPEILLFCNGVGGASGLETQPADSHRGLHAWAF